ncbi:MAG: hypothetical protein VXW65_01750 [Pseudomonadota bacterium]|nr:hypothetical protein [Pseudomonadota bacterium]
MSAVTFSRKPISLLPLLLGQCIILFLLLSEFIAADLQSSLILVTLLGILGWASYVTRSKDVQITLDVTALTYHNPARPRENLCCPWSEIDEIIEEERWIRLEMTMPLRRTLVIRFDEWQDAELLVSRIYRYMDQSQAKQHATMRKPAQLSS